MSPVLIGADSAVVSLTFGARASEQQPQALTFVVAEAGQVQVVVIGDCATLEQQACDVKVGRARDRAAASIRC